MQTYCGWVVSWAQDYVMSMASGCGVGQTQFSTRLLAIPPVSLVTLGKLLNLSFRKMGILLVPTSQDYT